MTIWIYATMGRVDDPDDALVEAEPQQDDDGVCWVCGGPTDERHCKIVCLNCGFMRDCSDP
jgi:hypothetical protein